MRNPYKHIGAEPIIGTNRGNPELFIGKLDNQTNFQNSINNLMSTGISLGYTSVDTNAAGKIPQSIADTIETLKEENEKNHQH